MMKATCPGVLYFISEIEHDGTPSANVKIGIIRDNERSRTVEERVSEHQTGNPRELRILFAERSDLVERVETELHAEFSTLRWGGEWFHLPDNSLEEAVNAAKARIESANSLGPKVRHVESLASQESNDAYKSQMNDDLKVHADLKIVRKRVKLIDKRCAELVAELHQRQQSDGHKENWVLEVRRNGRISFDKANFELEQPELFEAFRDEKVTLSGSFRLLNGNDSEVSSSDIEDPRESFLLSKKVEGQSAELHRDYLKLLSIQAELRWKAEELETALRLSCGTNSGIEGICTWARKMKSKSVLNTDRLKLEFPEIYARYLIQSADSIVLIGRKDNGYRTPALLTVAELNEGVSFEPMGDQEEVA